jgi:hypothetical protein
MIREHKGEQPAVSEGMGLRPYLDEPEGIVPAEQAVRYPEYRYQKAMGAFGPEGATADFTMADPKHSVSYSGSLQSVLDAIERAPWYGPDQKAYMKAQARQQFEAKKLPPLPEAPQNENARGPFRVLADQSKPTSLAAALEGVAQPLPMDQASRMARAKEMGFDPVTYYQGRETPYPGRRAYQMITDSPGAASMFADTSLTQKGTQGGHVVPMMVNREGFADLANPEHLERIAQRLVARHPVQVGPGRLTIEEARKQLADPSNIRDGRVHWAVEPIIHAAKEAGFTGVPVHENWGKWGWPDAHSLAVFDRSHLRSPQAAFDPAKRNSTDLLASDQGKGSKVGAVASGAGDQGPIRAYHGTAAKPFDRFKRKQNDVGVHFGTAGQANDRLAYMGKVENRPGEQGMDNARIYPVDLNIKNPLRVDDPGHWGSDNLRWAISKLADPFLSDEAMDAAMRRKGNETGKVAALRDMIMRRGYDGLVYKNTGETAGAAPYRQAMDAAWQQVVEANKRGELPINGFTPKDQQHPAYKAWREADDTYRKYREDNAQDSYVAIKPGTVKSATSGETLFADQGKGGKVGAVVQGAQEWPVGAAFKVGDKIYSGVTHFDALEAAVPGAAERGLIGGDLSREFERIHGKEAADQLGEGGFVTNKGRYVTREEAAELAKAKLGKVPFGTAFGGGLDSVQFEKALAKHEGRPSRVGHGMPWWLTTGLAGAGGGLGYWVYQLAKQKPEGQ